VGAVTAEQPKDRATLQTEFDAALAKLTSRQHSFVLELLKGKSLTEAAIDAGFSERTARSQASRMLTNVNISEAIDLGRKLAARDAVMEASEVLERLTAIGRGSLGDDFLRIERITYHKRMPVARPTEEDPKAVEWVEDPIPVERVDYALDLMQAKERGKLHLVKKYKDSPTTGLEIELHDPVRALELLGRHHKLFITVTELTGKDGAPIEVKDARSRLLERLARRAADADEG
jgi:phage terminase small subunit